MFRCSSNTLNKATKIEIEIKNPVSNQNPGGEQDAPLSGTNRELKLPVETIL